MNYKLYRFEVQMGDFWGKYKFYYYPFLRRRDLELSLPSLSPDSKARTKEKEAELFRYLHWRIFSLYQASKRHKKTKKGTMKSARIVKESLMLRDRIKEAQELAVCSNIGLVYDLIGKCKFNADYEDLASEGLCALLRSVEAFDFMKGFKFSTYACRNIISAMSRVYRNKIKNGPNFDQQNEHSIADDLADREFRERLNVGEYHGSDVARAMGVLDNSERQIIDLRFPQIQDQKGLTLQVIGEGMNISKERVRQIQERALRKMREALESKSFSPSGLV